MIGYIGVCTCIWEENTFFKKGVLLQARKEGMGF